MFGPDLWDPGRATGAAGLKHTPEEVCQSKYLHCQISTFSLFVRRPAAVGVGACAQSGVRREITVRTRNEIAVINGYNAESAVVRCDRNGYDEKKVRALEFG